MRVRLTLLLLAVLALLGVGYGLGWFHRPDTPQTQAATPPISVTTAPVVVGDVPVGLNANGIVQPIATVSVRTRVDGQIERVHVEEGARVKAGDVLFTLDTRPNLAILAQLQANLERDRTQLAQAQADAARYDQLTRTGAGARQQADQTRSQALSLAATVKADEALIAQTQLQIDYATIRAEIDGRLGTIPQKQGNYVRVAENTVLATLTRLNPVQVQFAIPERFLSEVRVAYAANTARVQVRAPSGNTTVEGRLVFMDSQVDVTTGTIMLKAQFENEHAALWPGQYVNVTLIPHIDHNVITVPVAAVQTGQSGQHVYVLGSDGKVTRRPVRMLRLEGDRAVLSGELTAGESVVVEGAQRLTGGTRAIDRGQPRPAAGNAG